VSVLPASTPVVSSSANPRFKRIRSLINSSRERRREGASVLEGIHLVESWLAHRAGDSQPLLELAIAERAQACDDIGALIERAGTKALVVQDRLFDSLGTLPSPAPVLALVRTPEPVMPACIDQDAVLLDRIQDPGNVGAILRSVAAAGIARVITTPHTAWCWSPKVLRAAMGGHFGLSIHESISWAALAPLIRIPLAGTIVHGGTSLYELSLSGPCVWVFGNEGEGIATEIQSRLDWRATIPQAAAVESLNVAAAAAVCLFEQRRQRLVAHAAGLRC